MAKTSLRFRIDFDGLCSVGFGKISLLEAIARTGSLSQGARDLGMSYRRAWLLMDSMNNGFNEMVVTTSTGGSGGGGATLTAFGQRLIDAFRALEPELDLVAEKHMRDIAACVVKRPRQRAGRAAVSKRSMSKKTSTSRS